MRLFFAALIGALIIIIPTGIIYYIFSYSIVELFSKEVYTIVIFALAFLILVWNVFKKLSKYFKRL
jgi:hypothetical protein